jgi:hypothetical protein
MPLLASSQVVVRPLRWSDVAMSVVRGRIGSLSFRLVSGAVAAGLLR